MNDLAGYTRKRCLILTSSHVSWIYRIRLVFDSYMYILPLLAHQLLVFVRSEPAQDIWVQSQYNVHTLPEGSKHLQKLSESCSHTKSSKSPNDFSAFAPCGLMETPICRRKLEHSPHVEKKGSRFFLT